MKKITTIIVFITIIQFAFSQEIIEEYRGISFESRIIDTNVNVRDYPSLEGKIIGKLNKGDNIVITGMSENSDSINAKTYYWLQVYKIDNVDKTKNIYGGWVFGQYIEFDKKIKPLQLKYGNYIKATSKKVDILQLYYSVNNKDVYFEIHPDKINNQEFYTFAWASDDPNYHYRNIPGSYIWIPNTNEIRHISYWGQTSESGWVRFTDDFLFEIEDFGTGPGPRGVSIWSLKKKEMIFNGQYYDDIFLNKHSIKIVYPYYQWKKDTDFDKEILDCILEFSKKNPKEPRTDGFIDLIIVECLLDLDNLKREILGAKYIITN